eukprot:4079526-Amphidinium_carterae.1
MPVRRPRMLSFRQVAAHMIWGAYLSVGASKLTEDEGHAASLDSTSTLFGAVCGLTVTMLVMQVSLQHHRGRCTLPMHPFKC